MRQKFRTDPTPQRPQIKIADLQREPRYGAKSPFPVAALAVGAALAAAGCGLDPPDDKPSPEVATSESSLVLTDRQSWAKDPNGVTTTLRVCWDRNSTLTGDPNIPMLQRTVRRAVESTWQRNSRVSFVGWDLCTGGEQVTAVIINSRAHTDPFIGPHKFTYLDFTTCGPDPQALADCVYKTAVHEFGHVLGFAHEQTRTDTPASCTSRDYWDGLITLAGGAYYGAWDINSVMNYCNPMWNNDGRLSRTDILGLQMAYGKPPGASACQRASDLYGIVAFQTWGFAPPDVQAWWTANHCTTAPLERDTCQRISDLYGTSAGLTWGFAPASVQNVWASNGCTTQPKGPNACQRASDLYAIVPYVSWGYAPPDVQTWWNNNNCGNAGVQPAQTNTCQRISDLYGVDAGLTWGFAPEAVRTFWTQNNCQTHPGLLAVRGSQP